MRFKYIGYVAAGVIITILLFCSTIKALELIRYEILGHPIVVVYDQDGEAEVSIDSTINFVLRSDGLVGWQQASPRSKRKQKEEEKGGLKSFPIGREIFGGTK